MSTIIISLSRFGGGGGGYVARNGQVRYVNLNLSKKNDICFHSLMIIFGLGKGL